MCAWPGAVLWFSEIKVSGGRKKLESNCDAIEMLKKGAG